MLGWGERSSKTWLVETPRLRNGNGQRRISANIAGESLWFESPDVALRPAAEVFVAAIFLPALRHRAAIATVDPLDSIFLDGLADLRRIYAAWWGWTYDATAALVPCEANQPSADAVGQCFTCGVDSSYSLRKQQPEIDVLVFVHGFDIPLGDTQRWQHAEASVRRVAELLGKQVIVVRTNLREHPVSERVNWERAHGGGLAAVGHALAGQLGRFIIPPSFRADRLRPWGSDPRTDAHYSSSRLQVEHPLCLEGRAARIAAIADCDFVQQHLRVCFENRTSWGNCSRCEKCLSTMATLDALGRLDSFPVFEQPALLARRLDDLPHIRHHAGEVWEEIAALQHQPAVAEALSRLLRRRPPHPLRRAYRRLKRSLVGA